MLNCDAEGPTDTHDPPTTDSLSQELIVGDADGMITLFARPGPVQSS